MLQLALGTRDGVVVFEGGLGGWKERYRTLEGEDILVVRFFPNDSESFLAGSYGHGLFRSTTQGEEVTKLPLDVEYMRTICFAPWDSSTVFAGTEPAELYRSRDRGNTWSSLELHRLPQAKTWSLPYSPRAGALRSLIVTRAQPYLILAGVEQGGFLRSQDDGRTWYLEDTEVDKDIHSLAIRGENPFGVFAATGEGVYRSVDEGTHWKRLTEEYTRAVSVAQDDLQTVFAGPAADVGEGGWITVSHDGGATWRRCMAGLPDPLEGMVQMLYTWPNLPGKVLALLSDGRLFESDTTEVRWSQICAQVEGIQSVALTEP